jgi:hypothetical protein
MFNRSSTSSERHDYLEQLIEGEDEVKDDDEDIPDDEILNQVKIDFVKKKKILNFFFLNR